MQHMSAYFDSIDNDNLTYKVRLYCSLIGLERTCTVKCKDKAELDAVRSGLSSHPTFKQALKESNFIQDVLTMLHSEYRTRKLEFIKTYRELLTRDDIADWSLFRLVDTISFSYTRLDKTLSSIVKILNGTLGDLEELHPGISEELLSPFQLKVYRLFDQPDEDHMVPPHVMKKMISRYLQDKLWARYFKDVLSDDMSFNYSVYEDRLIRYYNMSFTMPKGVPNVPAFITLQDTGSVIPVHKTGDYYYCNDACCFNENHPEYDDDDDCDEDEDERDHSTIKSYGTNALHYLSFKHLNSDKKNYRGERLYLGVELEVQTRGDLDDTAESVQDNLEGFAILCEDSSIDGDGFEIISAPATHAYHLKAWDNFFTNCAGDLRGWHAKSCGMHVHLSRKAFDTPLHQSKFITFINHKRNLEFMEKVAGRSSNNYTKMIHKNVGREALQRAPDRYQAVNLANSATLEVRIFQSNVAKKGFFKNIEFCAALFEYTKTCSLFHGMKGVHHNTADAHHRKQRSKHSHNQVYQSLSWMDFCLWCGQLNNRKKYVYLTDWLAAHGYIKSIKKVRQPDMLTSTQKEIEQCA